MSTIPTNRKTPSCSAAPAPRQLSAPEETNTMVSRGSCVGVTVPLRDRVSGQGRVKVPPSCERPPAILVGSGLANFDAVDPTRLGTEACCPAASDPDITPPGPRRAESGELSMAQLHIRLPKRDLAFLHQCASRDGERSDSAEEPTFRAANPGDGFYVCCSCFGTCGCCQ